LYIESPEIFYRQCDDCRKYIYFKGKKQFGPDGEAIERDSSSKLNCTMCGKWDSEMQCVWEDFTPHNAYIFKTFLAARAFKALPRRGGIDDQDPEMMTKMIALNEMFELHDSLSDKEFQAKLAGAKLGVR